MTYSQSVVAGPLYNNDVIRIAGDSLTYYGEQSGGWIDKLRTFNSTYHGSMNLDIHGTGVLAETSTGLLARFEDVLASGPDDSVPHILCIHTGINDCNEAYVYGGWSTRLATFISNMEDMIEAAQTAEVRQIIMMTPLLWGELANGYGPYDSMIMDVHTAIYNIGQDKDVPYIDCRDNFLDLVTAYNTLHSLSYSWQGVETSDGVHLNAKGQQDLCDQWVAAVGE